MKKSSAFLVLFAATASLSLSARLVAQQEPKPVRDAAATITAADVERRLWIIAHDSMGGRDTPSRGLDLTAQYVADEFRRFGLKPGGENGTYFQRYAIERRKFDVAASQLMLHGASSHAMASFQRDAMYLGGAVPAGTIEADLVAVGTMASPEQLDKAAVRGKVVLLVYDYTKANPASLQRLVGALNEGGPLAILRVSNRD